MWNHVKYALNYLSEKCKRGHLTTDIHSLLVKDFSTEDKSLQAPGCALEVADRFLQACHKETTQA